ncbi:hypothetical protein ACS0TY_010929 [Phlomoides rotata]
MHHVDMSVCSNGNRWRLTGYYSYPKRNMRTLSWNLLRHLATINNLPWVCIGDYLNDLLWARDKEGRVEHPSYLFCSFRDVVNDCGLLDLNLVGHPFTWSRGRGSRDFVQQHLDRAMTTNAWNSLFPRAKLLNLITPVSNHSPILLDVDLRFVQKHRKDFKFENIWLGEKDLPEVVRRLKVCRMKIRGCCL